jgi:two-component system response regulator HydG
MTDRSILVIDDEPDLALVIANELIAEGTRCKVVTSGAAALSACRQEAFDLVVSDIRLGPVDGVELMTELRRIHPGLPVVLVTAEGSIAAAVEAMQRGASQYITKPFQGHELRRIVDEALRHRAEVKQPVAQGSLPLRTAELLGSSEAMELLRQRIDLIASARSPVLVTGETGTGKELVARAIHACSDRRVHPFVTVNAAAIPDALLESEMFGHARGAFTGATQLHRGLFEEADKGTLFLDEIGDMPPSLQSKLLRALQTGEIRSVGGTRSRNVDVRVIAATHRNLPMLVKEGGFRADLFYRLNVVHVAVPPLRARRSDIPELVSTFVARARERAPHSPVRTVSSDLVELLARGSWPGNVRELQSIVERLVVLATVEQLDLHHLELCADEVVALIPRKAPTTREQSSTIDDVVRGHVEGVLMQTQGHKGRAAKILGVDLSTLYRWQHKWK